MRSTMGRCNRRSRCAHRLSQVDPRDKQLAAHGQLDTPVYAESKLKRRHSESVKVWSLRGGSAEMVSYLMSEYISPSDPTRFLPADIDHAAFSGSVPVYEMVANSGIEPTEDTFKHAIHSGSVPLVQHLIGKQMSLRWDCDSDWLAHQSKSPQMMEFESQIPTGQYQPKPVTPKHTRPTQEAQPPGASGPPAEDRAPPGISAPPGVSAPPGAAEVPPTDASPESEPLQDEDAIVDSAKAEEEAAADRECVEALDDAATEAAKAKVAGMEDESAEGEDVSEAGSEAEAKEDSRSGRSYQDVNGPVPVRDSPFDEDGLAVQCCGGPTEGSAD